MSSIVRTPPPTVSGMKISVGRPRDDIDHRLAAVAAGRDVEKDQFVRAFAVVEGGQLDRIAGIAQVDELDALDHATIGHIEAGDDAAGQCGCRCYSAMSVLPRDRTARRRARGR